MADDEFEPDDSHEQQQEHLYELIGFRDEDSLDPLIHDMFFDVMYNDELSYNQRVEMYERLAEYLSDAYGLDFEDLWDWEDFREWYDSV